MKSFKPNRGSVFHQIDRVASRAGLGIWIWRGKIQQLKGYTSRILRQEFETLRTRIPTLWTRSYYIESCGHISEDTVKKYIEEPNGL